MGYYAAALTIDWKFWGRRRMTTIFFFMVRWFCLCSTWGLELLTHDCHHDPCCDHTSGWHLGCSSYGKEPTAIGCDAG